MEGQTWLHPASQVTLDHLLEFGSCHVQIRHTACIITNLLSQLCYGVQLSQTPQERVEVLSQVSPESSLSSCVPSLSARHRHHHRGHPALWHSGVGGPLGSAPSKPPSQRPQARVSYFPFSPCVSVSPHYRD